MRLAVLLVLALVAAGCTRPAEDDVGSPTSPSDATPAATPRTAAPTTAPTPTPSATSPSPTPSPAPPTGGPTGSRPFSGFWTHDHQEDARVETFDVPPGAPPADISVLIFPSAPTMGCDARAAQVTVHDPAGLVVRARGTDDMYCGDAASVQNATLRPGRWTIWFNGSAPARSTVAIGDANRTQTEGREDFRYDAEHDFGNPPEEDTFVVPADAGPIDIRLAFEPSLAAACFAAPTVSIELVPPAGDGYATMLGLGGGGASGCGTPLEVDAADLAPGTWTVRFAGSGSARGIVSLAAS